MVVRVPLWLGVAALALAAPIAAADDVVKVRIVARDGVFTPSNVDVPAGKRIKIEIANEGRTPMEFESLPLKVEKVLGPGASSSVVINPLKPGEYPFFDDFHPDTSKGRIVAR
jgi:plastocyanin